MNKDAFEKVLKISEEFFGSVTDPDQMPISKESADKLTSLHPDTIVYKFNDSGDPIGWVVVVPTSLAVMDDFLNKKITERELLDIAAKDKKFESLYLCAVFVLPEFRRKGYAMELLLEAIEKVSGGKSMPLYGWIYSKEGASLVKAIEDKLKIKIVCRK